MAKFWLLVAWCEVEDQSCDVWRYCIVDLGMLELTVALWKLLVSFFRVK